MIKSKAWNWDIASAPWWTEPAGEVYPLLKRWKNLGFEKMLDLGCGISRHSILFAKNGFKVDAADFSRDGIEKLVELVKKERLNIVTKVTDMISLPYDDNYFDCLIAFHAIYHTDDAGIKKAIGEIERVLKAGGEALITFNSKGSSVFKDPHNKYLTENTIVKTKGHETGIPHFYANKEDVEQLIKSFETIEFSYKEEYYPDFTGAHYFVLVKKKG
jgi:ubiquinone/menaquinone biosynthesis C-methylase UbiE